MKNQSQNEKKGSEQKNMIYKSKNLCVVHCDNFLQHKISAKHIKTFQIKDRNINFLDHLFFFLKCETNAKMYAGCERAT